MQSRKEQKEKRREEILEVALDQFIRKGYAATKIKDIADAAHISVGLLFHYYESKEEVYTQLIQYGIKGPQMMLAGISPVEPLEFFQLCAKQTLFYAQSSLFTAKMFVLMNAAYYSEGTPLKARKMALSIDFYKEVVPIVERGQQNGTIRQGDPLSLSTAFWTALQGAIQAYALNPELKLPEAEWILDIITEKGGKS